MITDVGRSITKIVDIMITFYIGNCGFNTTFRISVLFQFVIKLTLCPVLLFQQMHCPLDCTLSKDFIQNLIIDSLCDNTALLYPKLSNLSFIKNNFCPIIKPDSCFSLLKRYDRHDLKTHFYSSSSNTSGSPSASVSSAVPSNWNFSLTFASTSSHTSGFSLR